MTDLRAPETLTRPLAARVAHLPEAADIAAGPFIPTPVIEAALEALDSGKTHYTDRPGILGLRQWASDYLKRHTNVELKPGDITITCGSTEARFVTLKRLLKPGDTILCPGDSSRIAGAASLIGLPVTPIATVPTTVSLLYLSPADAPAVRDPLLIQAAAHRWWVLWDISAGSSDFHPSQDRLLAPRVITVGSLSQVMPGWRVGWMGGSEMADKLRAYKQSMTICTTSISQWAGIGAAIP